MNLIGNDCKFTGLPALPTNMLHGVRTGQKRTKFRLLLILTIAAVTLAASGTSCRQYRSSDVLKTAPDLLQQAGAHFVVGFDTFTDIRPLAAKGAIAGIYLTRRNVNGKTVQQIRTEILALQQLRRQAGRPPLIVAADQEGGPVNHLSPPLPSFPSLVTLVGAAVNRADLIKRTMAYARQQGRGLKGIGVNLNLGPVVDLPEKGAWLKGQTCLGRRAIAEDKATVSQVAEAYCQGMNRVGVWPTLKHFPGLGQVAEETHRQEGFLDTQLAKLSMRDWVPFRQVMEKTRTFLMLGHVRLKCVDAQHMVWASPAVVQGLLRDQWRFNGILITDDLTMGAVRRTGAGIGAVAIQALNAGVDLLLLSYDSRQYYPAMAAVLEALEQGTLDLKRLAQSRHRLAGLWTSSIAAESEKPGNSS